jgi:hypothetical protein
MAKTPALKTEGSRTGSRRHQAMDRHDNWLETENHFFDATVSGTDRMIDTHPRDDEPASDLSAVAHSAKPDARPSAGKSRVMMMGFHLIRV